MYFQSLLAPCAVRPLFGCVLPLCAGECSVMWVCSEIPFGTYGRSAACSAITVDHALARPAGRRITGQGHSLFKSQCLLATMNSGLRNSADSLQNTFSNSPKFRGFNDDGAFFVTDLAGTPRLCSTLCTNTSTKTNKTSIAGPLVATSYSMCALGTPNNPATWNSVSANTAASLIHAGAAKATSLLAHDDEA